MPRAILLALLLGLSARLHAACVDELTSGPAGTVRDAASNLTWSRCLLGLSGEDCAGDASSMSWVDALNEARGSELGGITNWRMPKIEEIEALYGHGCLQQVFPQLEAALVWSASANLDYATRAWAFDFAAGERLVKTRESELQLLLVATPD